MPGLAAPVSIVNIQGIILEFELVARPVRGFFFDQILLLFHAEVLPLFARLQGRIVADLRRHSVDFLFKQVKMRRLQRRFRRTFKLIPLKFWLR